MNRLRAPRGFALMAALWLLVALSTLALELSVVARQRRLAIANTLESVRAERAAESGVQHVRAHLGALLNTGREGDSWNDAPDPIDPWRTVDPSRRDSATMDDGASYAVTTADVGTKVNLNVVDETGLQRFLAASSIDAITADALSQAIMDWRDADDFRRLRGAERADYTKDGARELPTNGPFESVDELRFVRGMTPSILAKIAPSLTVFGEGEVNVNKASEAVLLSVPGLTPLAAVVIVGAQRSRRRIDTLRQLLDMLPAPARTALAEHPTGAGRLSFDTHEVEVRSTGWLPGSPIRVRETAVITRVGTVPVVTWRFVE